MNIHKNAKTTPKMRGLIVERRQAGETPRSIASAVGVSAATVRKWLRRHESEGVAGLQDRTSRPHRRRTRITSHQIAQVEALRRTRQPFWKIAREAGLSRATVARIAKAKGLSRLSALDPKIEIIRYEKKQPGEMIHIDIKKLGRIEGVGHRITGDRTGQSAPRSRKEGGKGWEYLHLAVDDHSRLAYSEILPDETRRSCLKFLFNALRFFRDHGVKVLRVMTDNGVSFRSHRYAKALRMLKIKHKRTRPYTPRTNGKAERFVQTSLREWAKLTKGSSRRSLLEWSAEGYAKPYNHSSERTAALLPFLHHYNHHRPHFGINGCPPISRIPRNTYRDTTQGMAETKKDALAAFDAFIETWGVKYDKAVECLIKDRDALLAFYDFPAEHWKHLRTTNPIESSFATVRHRTVRSKGCLSNKTALAMIFKLAEVAEKNWRRLDGHNQLPKIILGVRFTDGIEVVKPKAQAAAA